MVGIVQVVPTVRMRPAVVADHGGIAQGVVFPRFGTPQDLRRAGHIQRQVPGQIRQVDALQVIVELAGNWLPFRTQAGSPPTSGGAGRG